MKKLFLFVLALLLMSGVSYAAGIPTVVDPANGPEIWTQEVFNDSGGTLVSGDVVVWDYTDSDMYQIENRKMYVTTTATADNIAVAGVIVDPSCADQGNCTIAIYGPVKAKSTVAGCTTGSILGTGGTAKITDNYSNTGDNDGTLGWCVYTSSDATKGGGINIPIVFVNPQQDASP